MSSEGKRCQICGDDHPPMAPHRPGEIQRLASEIERLEAEQIENSKANTRVARSMGERADAAEAEVERLESELIASEAGRKSACAERERLREAIGRFLEVCDRYGCFIGRGAGEGHETLDDLRAVLHPDEREEP